jgi:hypothetical protein
MIFSGTGPSSTAGSVPVPPTAPEVVLVTYGAPMWVLIVVASAGFVVAIAAMLAVRDLRRRRH